MRHKGFQARSKDVEKYKKSQQKKIEILKVTNRGFRDPRVHEDGARARISYVFSSFQTLP